MSSSLLPPTISVVRLHPDAKFPTTAYGAPVGLDLFACLRSDTGRPIQKVLSPSVAMVIPTGFIFVPPAGYFLAVCTRSGMAAKATLCVYNAPGIIDPDYRGELKVILYNGGHSSVFIKHEDPIAQLVLLPHVIPKVLEKPFDQLSVTERASAGLGSTDPKSY